ncbi:hypothetical protein F975_01757 [Acinetobacter sp. ANC 3789]|uniref:hypothetical protein n=1 Tax=Acinetobacter sp. ANC 3789 TaxID=1217714 RepID=UPI0002CDE4D3|nr:hypothetical protein [Acinetobacter sp. ANC 3789]ENU80005.1 hypothetical protein F975_01757 [Acinetobacter sp. ANC 3789]
MSKIEIKLEQRNVLTPEAVQQFMQSDRGKKICQRYLDGMKQKPMRKKHYFQRLIHKFFG